MTSTEQKKVPEGSGRHGLEKRKQLPTMLLIIAVLLFATNMLASCSSGEPSNQAIASNVSDSSLAISSEARVEGEEPGSIDVSDASSADASIEQLVIETDEYTLVLPSEWAESAEVSYGEGTVQVHLKNHSELSLLRMLIVDASHPVVGGDIGNGCFRRVDLPDGRRLEFWSTNWLFILGTDASQHAGKYDYLGDAGKETLISLTCSKEIELTDLPQIGTNYYDTNYLEEYYSHMDELVMSGLEMKV